MEKKCKVCEKELNLKYFYKVKKNKDGRGSKCSNCLNEHKKEKYRRNTTYRNKRIEYSRKYRLRNG